jgi:hypothetical protein
MGDTQAEEEKRRPGGTRVDGIWNPLFAVKDAPPPSWHSRLCCDQGGTTLHRKSLAAYCTVYSMPSWELKEVEVSIISNLIHLRFRSLSVVAVRGKFFHRPCFLIQFPFTTYCIVSPSYRTFYRIHTLQSARLSTPLLPTTFRPYALCERNRRHCMIALGS